MKTSLIILLALISTFCYSQELRIEEKKDFSSGKDFVVNADFSPFRNFFALARRNNTLEIYDRNWNLVFEHQGNKASYAGVMAFSPDETMMAYGRYKGDNDIIIIDLKELKVKQTLRGHSFFINDLSFSNDGNFLASVSQDNTMVLWKYSNRRFEKQKVYNDYEDNVQKVRFSFDDKYIITTDNDGYVCIYEYRKDEYQLIQKVKTHYSYTYSLDYNPVKHEFMAGASSSLIKFSLHNNRFIRSDSIKESIDPRNGIEYSPDGDYAFIPHYSRLMIFRNNEESLKEIDGIYRHSETVLGSSFSDDGQFLASWSVDSSLIIWNVSPLIPSKKTLISSWVNDNLTPALRRALTYDFVLEIYSKTDKDLAKPRNEFETSSEYNERRKILEDHTLALIQEKVEKNYDIKKSSNIKVRIPIQNIIGYNADLQIYKILFMETEAGVDIPVEDAKAFKSKWKRSYIEATKSRINGNKSYKYSDFRLIIPGISNSFEVKPLENPFHLENQGTSIDASSENRTATTSTSSSEKSSAGDGVVSHALLFATNVYDSFSDLVNPVLDATTIGAELSDNYNVITEVVTNPTLIETVEKIREYASRQYNDNENLLIFFAGHGEYDEVFQEGYIISSDSKQNDLSKTSYLSHSNLRTMINNIGCEHILLVMDVCFGGTIDPGIARASHRGSMQMYSDIPREEFIERKQKYKTRLYLTSGGKEYVPDGRLGFHSPFARRFIESLRMYGGEDGVLTTSEILQFVEKVNPQPRFGEFGDNEPGSDFILVSK